MKANKRTRRRIVDIILAILLLSLMSYQYTSQEIHDLFGIAMFCFVLIHIAQNAHWYKKVLRGKYSFVRIINTFVNTINLVCILLLTISGIMMSKILPVDLIFGGGTYIARLVHLSCSHIGFIMMSLHVGLHFGILSAIGKKYFNKNLRFIIKTIATIIGVYGLYSVIELKMFDYVFLKTEFYMWSMKGNFITFFMQNLSIMVFFIMITHYLMKLSDIVGKNKNKTMVQ